MHLVATEICTMATGTTFLYRHQGSSPVGIEYNERCSTQYPQFCPKNSTNEVRVSLFFVKRNAIRRKSYRISIKDMVFY